jgi:hypothetical protein
MRIGAALTMQMLVRSMLRALRPVLHRRAAQDAREKMANVSRRENLIEKNWRRRERTRFIKKLPLPPRPQPQLRDEG